eukprot:168923_1
MNNTSFINAVLIGNVNAGKSSLCGRIAYHLGMASGTTLLEYRKQAQELQRESYYLAWWSDRTDIERERGITIHNHFHCWRFPETNTVVNITDISGYEYYLKNAIAGCAFNDVAILLIDINPQFNMKGIQELPHQHYMGSVLQQLILVKALNIKKIILVLNKCDLFLNHVGHYQSCVENIKHTIVNIANKLAMDIKNLFHPFIIPISTTNGWNISQQKDHLLAEHGIKCIKMDTQLDDIYSCCWLNDYNHHMTRNTPKTLLEVVSQLNTCVTYDNDDAQTSMKASIKRVSITKSHLLLLYCIVIHGRVRSDMTIRVHPCNIALPIYSIQSFKQTIDIAYAGQLICIAVQISDINTQHLANVGYNIDNMNNKFITKYFQRGSLITNISDGGSYGPIEYFECTLDIIYAPYDLKMGYEMLCYSHCTRFRATLMHCFDKSWNNIQCMNIKRNNHDSIKDLYRLYSGEKVTVGFNVVDKQIVLMSNEDCPCLGWIVIKGAKSYIVAIGKILYCGLKVTKAQIYKAMTEISSGGMVSLTDPILSIIAEYAKCGY